MPLVNTPNAVQFMQFLGTDAGRKGMMGDFTRYDAAPATKLAKLHYAVDDAVKRVNGLEWDKTRTPPQQHQAGRKIAEAVVAEITKTRAEVKQWADMETASAMAEIDRACRPTLAPPRKCFVRKSGRLCCRRRATSTLSLELRSLVETDLRFATAIFEAPAALSGISPERHEHPSHVCGDCPCPRSRRTGSRGAGSCIA